MRPCNIPNALCAAATAALALASSVTSVRTKRVAAPNSAESALPCASLTSASTTLAPPSTSMRAVAAPRPEAPPVTIKTPLEICMRLLFLCLEYGRRRRDQPGQVRQIRRHDQRVVGLGDIGERGHVLLGHLQIDCVHPTRRGDRLGDLLDRLGV